MHIYSFIENLNKNWLKFFLVLLCLWLSIICHEGRFLTFHSWTIIELFFYVIYNDENYYFNEIFWFIMRWNYFENLLIMGGKIIIVYEINSGKNKLI